MRIYSLILRLLACLAIFFAISISSCRRKSPDQTDVKQAEPDTAVGMPADNIAVIVNGVDIPESKVEQLIKPQLDAIAKQGAQLGPEFAEQSKNQLRQQALEQLISEQLLDAKVKEANTEVTEEEVMSKIEEIASSQKEPLSLEEFRKKIEGYGMSFDDIREDVYKGLSRDKFMKTQWAGKVDVTEDDARKFYDDNPKRFEIPEQVRASHILIKPDFTDPNTDPNEAKANAKARIEDLLGQIKDGADLAELAKANSVCPSAADGGDLGFFPRGQTTPPFEKVAFELEVEQVSDVVETEYGYHIIKVTGHMDAGVVSFEQAKEKIIEQLTQAKKDEFVRKYIESLRAEAEIIYPPRDEP